MIPIRYLLLKTVGKESILLMLFIFIFGYWAISYGQDNNWDLLDYHFYNGFAFLHHRFKQDVAAAMVQTWFNPGFDVVNYLLIISQPAVVVGFALGAISGLNCFLIYKIAILLFNNLPKRQRLTCLIFSILLGNTGTVGIALLGTTTNDTKMTFLVLIGIYCVLKAILDTRPSIKYICTAIAGLFLGFATAFKFPAACYAVGFCVGLVFSRNTIRPYLPVYCLFIAATLAGFLIADGYWMYRLYTQFQNPIFPYHNDIFHSAYAPFSDFKDEAYHPHHYLTLPFYFAVTKDELVEENMRDIRLALIYSLSIFMFIQMAYCRFFSKKTTSNKKMLVETPALNAAWRFVFIGFVASYLVWFFEFTIYRFTLPLELLSGILITFLIYKIFESEKIRLLLFMITLIASFKTTCVHGWGRVHFGDKFFSMRPPKLPHDAVVLFMNGSFGHTIPFFSEDIHFVGLPVLREMAIRQKGLSLGKIETELVEPLLKTHKKKIYTLGFKNIKPEISARFLARYHIIQNKTHCNFFTTNIGEQLELCTATFNT